MSETSQYSNRIFYCERCGLRIPPADLAAQRARLVDENEAVCAACEGRAATAATPATPPAPASHAVMQAASVSAGAKSARRSTAHSHPAPRSGKNDALPWKPALAGAVAVGTLLGLIALSRSKPSETTVDAKPVRPETKNNPVAMRPQESKPETARPAAPQPLAAPAPRENSPAVSAPSASVKTQPENTRAVKTAAPEEEYDPRKAVAESLLAQAREFEKKNPDDVFGYRDKLQFLIERYRGTAAADEAGALIAQIKLPAFDPERHPEPTSEGAWANAVPVLGWVDAKKDALKGNWSLHNGALRSDRSTWSKLGVPYEVPEEYDLRFSFARLENSDCLLIVLARRGKPFIFSIGSGNRLVSFEDIRESRKDVVPTKLSRDGIYPNGTQQQVVVQVRKNCLRAYLNGKLIVGCQVDDEGLSLRSELTMPQPYQIGFMTWDSVYEIQSLEVLPLKGEGKALR